MQEVEDAALSIIDNMISDLETKKEEGQEKLD